MQTSTLVDFLFSALIVILVALSGRRRKKPRYKRRPEPTDAEIRAKRLQIWEAYLKERAGGHPAPGTEDPRRSPPYDG